jgi:hypothetical protein
VIGQHGLSVWVLGALPALNVDQEGVVASLGHIPTAGCCTPDVHNCFMINTPWVFNALWYFIKGLLAARFVCSPSVDEIIFTALP